MFSSGEQGGRCGCSRGDLVGDSEEHWDPMDDQQGDLVGDLVGDSEEHLDLADDWQGDLVDAMEI